MLVYGTTDVDCIDVRDGIVIPTRSVTWGRIRALFR